MVKEMPRKSVVAPKDFDTDWALSRRGKLFPGDATLPGGFECAVLISRAVQHAKYFYTSLHNSVINEVISGGDAPGFRRELCTGFAGMRVTGEKRKSLSNLIEQAVRGL
jgi:hypothetical protein